MTSQKDWLTMQQNVLLDVMTHDAASGVFTAHNSSTPPVVLALRREGAFMSVSASWGPLELALRPHTEELLQTIGRMRPVRGGITTRQVGSAHAYLALGMQVDSTLVVRVVAGGSAAGYVVLNLVLAPQVRRALFAWLGAQPAQDPDA